MVAGDSERNAQPTIAAIVLSYNRKDALAMVLDRLRALALDQVIVYDNASSDGTQEMVRARGDEVRLIASDRNDGFGGRNAAAEAANADLLLMLDDDAYPLPGAIETLRAAFVADSRLAVAGGFVIDVDETGRVLRSQELGTFDWFFRAGRHDADPAEGIPTFFFPEGACMIRRAAFIDVGGYFAPFFFTACEVDLTTRLVARGWDVRYFPQARFEHMKARAGRIDTPRVLRLRVRNQLWYFYRHFPAPRAIARILAYLAFDLVECIYRGAPLAWFGGIYDAIVEREAVRGSRRPLDRVTLRRAELERGKLHVRLLAGQLLRRLGAREKRA